MGEFQWHPRLGPRRKLGQFCSVHRFEKGKTNRGIVILDGNFLLANGAPKLNGELGNVFLFALHTHNAQAKESLLHVETHLLIV